MLLLRDLEAAALLISRFLISGKFIFCSPFLEKIIFHSLFSDLPYAPHVRAVPEIILRGGGPHFFADPSTPRTHMESEPPDPQDM